MSHYYHCPVDGPIETRYDADLREARKHNYFCSVTTIEKAVRANPRLAEWIQEETIKACCEYPRSSWEDDKGYAERIKKAAMKIADTAADFGTRLHDAIENYPQYPLDPEIQPFFDQYVAWHEENVVETISSEVMLANRSIGVAGKFDKIVVHKTHGMCAVDYKTQRVKARPNFYDSWVRQLAFYSETYSITNQCEAPKLLSVIIDSTKPSAPIEKLWTEEDSVGGWKEFVCHAWLFSSEKNYWPCGKWEIFDILIDDKTHEQIPL